MDLNITAVGELAPGIKLIVSGLKSLASGLSYFVYLPIKMAGYSPSPILAQLIYLGILTLILKRLTGRWDYALAIIVIMLVLGALI